MPEIYVGKIPDPKAKSSKSQIALIYCQFMDDMDAESEELGGEAKFFSGEYQNIGLESFFNKTRGGTGNSARLPGSIAKN